MEMVNHPSHYGGGENVYEVIKIIEHYKLNFCKGNVLKYLLRAGKKFDEKELEDLEKALWYLQREVDNIKKQRQEELARKYNPTTFNGLTDGYDVINLTGGGSDVITLTNPGGDDTIINLDNMGAQAAVQTLYSIGDMLQNGSNTSITITTGN